MNMFTFKALDMTAAPSPPPHSSKLCTPRVHKGKQVKDIYPCIHVENFLTAFRVEGSPGNQGHVSASHSPPIPPPSPSFRDVFF